MDFNYDLTRLGFSKEYVLKVWSLIKPAHDGDDPLLSKLVVADDSKWCLTTLYLNRIEIYYFAESQYMDGATDIVYYAFGTGIPETQTVAILFEEFDEMYNNIIEATALTAMAFQEEALQSQGESDVPFPESTQDQENNE